MAIEVDPGLFRSTGNADAEVEAAAVSGRQEVDASIGTPERSYVVLRHEQDEQDEPWEAWLELGRVEAVSRPKAWEIAVRQWPELEHGNPEIPVRARLVPARFWQEITAGSKLEPFVEGL